MFYNLTWLIVNVSLKDFIERRHLKLLAFL